MEKRKLSRQKEGQKEKEKIGMEGERSMIGNSVETIKKERRNNISSINYNYNSVNNTCCGNDNGSAKYKFGGKNTKCNNRVCDTTATRE